MSKLHGKRLIRVKVIGPDGQPALIDPTADIAIEDDLTEEMKEQPGLFAYYAGCAEQAQAKVKRLNYEIHCLHEDLDAAIRTRVLANKEKVTEAAITAEINRNPKMRTLYAKKIEANAVKGQLYALREAFAERKDMLQSIGASLRAEGSDVRTMRQLTKKAEEAARQLHRKHHNEE